MSYGKSITVAWRSRSTDVSYDYNVGTPEWEQWVLSEEEGIQHIKAAYVSLKFK
jgi:hypothetical protein